MIGASYQTGISPSHQDKSHSDDWKTIHRVNEGGERNFFEGSLRNLESITARKSTHMEDHVMLELSSRLPGKCDQRTFIAGARPS